MREEEREHEQTGFVSKVLYDYYADGMRQFMELYKDNGTTYETRNDYSYDEANRLTSTVAQTSAGQQTLGRSYDAAGRLLTEDLPGSYVVTYVYDGANKLLSKMTTRNLMDVSGVVYDYDDSGNRTQMVIKRDGATAYTIDYEYSQSSRLTRELRKDAVPNAVYDDAYLYDLAGNRLKRIRDKQAAGIETSLYAYDSRNHLEWEHTAKPGNVEEGIEYGYDENGCQVVKKKGDSDDIAQVVLDGEGNLVEIQWVAEPTLDVEEYAYSYEQRLTRCEDATDKVTVYGFDDSQRRVHRKIGAGSDQRFLYDGEDVVYEEARPGTVYVNGLGIDEKRLVVRGTGRRRGAESPSQAGEPGKGGRHFARRTASLTTPPPS